MTTGRINQVASIWDAWLTWLRAVPSAGKVQREFLRFLQLHMIVKACTPELRSKIEKEIDATQRWRFLKTRAKIELASIRDRLKVPFSTFSLLFRCTCPR